jgi:hypothetical protein
MPAHRFTISPYSLCSIPTHLYRASSKLIEMLRLWKIWFRELVECCRNRHELWKHVFVFCVDVPAPCGPVCWQKMKFFSLVRAHLKQNNLCLRWLPLFNSTWYHFFKFFYTYLFLRLWLPSWISQAIKLLSKLIRTKLSPKAHWSAYSFTCS